MDSGFYAALTGLVSRTDALDLAANNLANVSTTGYKAEREFYRALTASAAGGWLSPLNRAANDYSVLGGANIDLQSGSTQYTGNKLDLALEGSGFFTVQTPAGIRYTRNGSLHLSAQGDLLTQDGGKVLAVPQNPKLPPQPIVLPSGQISISTDGTISVDGAIVAQMKIVNFPQGTDLTPEGNSYFIAPARAEKPAADATVREGALESSNYNAVEGTIDLITLQRETEMMQRAVRIFYNDFQQPAAQDLPRVP